MGLPIDARTTFKEFTDEDHQLPTIARRIGEATTLVEFRPVKRRPGVTSGSRRFVRALEQQAKVQRNRKHAETKGTRARAGREVG